MFNRKAFKRAARQDLAGRWKTATLVSVISVIVLGISEIPLSLDTEEDLVLLLSLALSFIIPGIVSIALAYFFLQLATDKSNTTFSTFIEGMNLWHKGILGSLWAWLWIYLWTLLFIIPGIVKLFSYSQIYYILADYPNMSVKKALKLSIVMTKGYKGELFFLNLSFIGWGILCLLTVGVGFIFLVPYQMATSVNAYRFLKAQAIASGALQEADFSDRF